MRCCVSLTLFGWLCSTTVIWLPPLPTVQADPPARSGPTTILYEVGDLIQRPGRSGFDRIDDLIAALVSRTDAKRWQGKDAPTVREINHYSLQIRTTPEHHEEIHQILEAFRRLMDPVVEVKAELHEVERKFFDDHLAAIVKKQKGQPLVFVGEAKVKQLRGLGKPAQVGWNRIGNGKEELLLSRRQATPYLRELTGGEEKLGVVLHGFTIHATPHISSDRRFIDLTLTRQTVTLKGIAKKPAADGRLVDDPKLETVTTPLRRRVPDGISVLLPLTNWPEGKTTERVPVLLVQPQIVIGEEEKARQKAS